MTQQKYFTIDTTNTEEGTEYFIPWLLHLVEQCFKDSIWLLEQIDIGVEDTQEAITILTYSDQQKPISGRHLHSLLTQSIRVIDDKFYLTSIQTIEGNLILCKAKKESPFLKATIQDGVYITIETSDNSLHEKIQYEYANIISLLKNRSEP